MRSRYFSFHAQHVDEHVFEAGLGLLPGKRVTAAGPERVLERGAVHPSDTQSMSEYGGRLDTGCAQHTSCRGVQIAANCLEDDEARMSGDISRRALNNDTPIGKIDDALASLCLVHKMRGDEDGQPFAGHVMDQIPELTTRLRVNARRRLVQ